MYGVHQGDLVLWYFIYQYHFIFVDIFQSLQLVQANMYQYESPCAELWEKQFSDWFELYGGKISQKTRVPKIFGPWGHVTWRHNIYSQWKNFCSKIILFWYRKIALIERNNFQKTTTPSKFVDFEISSK